MSKTHVEGTNIHNHNRDGFTEGQAAELSRVDWSRYCTQVGVKTPGLPESAPYNWEALDAEEALIMAKLLERKLGPDLPAAIEVSPALRRIALIFRSMAEWAQRKEAEAAAQQKGSDPYGTHSKDESGR